MQIPITDPEDPRVGAYLGLRDHRLRMGRELPNGDLSGLFIAEGDNVIERALDAEYEILSMLRDPDRPSWTESRVPDQVPVYLAGPDVAYRLTGMHIHRGTMAAFRRPTTASADEVIGAARTILVGERIVNPTNLGVIVRSAAGLGLDGLLLDPVSCDPLYRRASRVAMGSSFSFPWARIDPLPPGLETVRRAGFTTIALTPDRSAVDISACPDAHKIALLVGNEGHGLSDETLEAADLRVRIPMANQVDSLNVGAAAAVACWVVTRRSGPGPQS